MLSEKLGHAFDKPLEGIARLIPFSPNSITIAGFIVTLFASYILLSNLFFGGILLLAGGFFDILDGVVARTNGKSSTTALSIFTAKELPDGHDHAGHKRHDQFCPLAARR
jgi:hypothetical protein